MAKITQQKKWQSWGMNWSSLAPAAGLFRAMQSLCSPCSRKKCGCGKKVSFGAGHSISFIIKPRGMGVGSGMESQVGYFSI